MSKTIYDRNATMIAAGERAHKANAASYDFNNSMGRAPEITPIRATEGLSVYTPSIISVLFSKLNGALGVSIEAERDIEHVNVWDPAIDHWLRDAEHAWGAVTEIRLALRAAPMICTEDKPLLVMADIVAALMSAETRAEYLSVQKRVRTAAYQLRCPGVGATPRRINQMLRQCHAHLSVMTEMDVYQPAFEPENLFDRAQDAWPEAC